MLDIIKLYKDFGIDHIGQGHKRARAGWTQTHCPFCSGFDYHLGYSSGGVFNCWRCGSKPSRKALKALLRISDEDVKSIEKKYLLSGSAAKKAGKRDKPELSGLTEIELPPETRPMESRHKKYLEKRGYDADRLEEVFGLKGTGHIGSYKHRIIAPIHLDYNLVSYQGRDITDRSELKYKACSTKDEAIHHKDILYGMDLIPARDIVIVEGIADVWRLGPGSACTFGTGFTMAQIAILQKRYDRYILLFDSEHEAQERAEALASALAGLASPFQEVEIAVLDQGDPGELNQLEADQIMKDLINGGWK